MFSVTHFRTEFIQQGQATILPRVTMTQFMYVIGLLAVGIGVLQIPFWLAPLLVVVAYGAGHLHNGEILLKRLVASLTVRGRTVLGMPRIVNVQAEWDSARLLAERQQVGGLLPTR